MTSLVERVASVVRAAAGCVPLAGKLRGAGPLPDDDVAHLAELIVDLDDIRDGLRGIERDVYIYRCARLREQEDARRAETRRNKRLAESIAAGSAAGDLDEIISYVRGNAAAFMHVPGPRAAQLADEVIRLRGELAEAQRLRTLGGPGPAVMARAQRLLRCDECGHMFNRHGQPDDDGNCVVMVEINHVDGVATGVEPCGCTKRRPA